MAGGDLNISKQKILVYDKSSSVRYTVGLALGREFEVEEYGGAREVWERLGRGEVDLAILGLEHPFPDYLPFLQALRKTNRRLPVLFLATKMSRPEITYPLSEVLVKPFFPRDMQERVRELLARGKREEGRELFSGASSRLGERVERWLVSGRVEAEVLERVERLCSLPLSVLIEGEEGTGKRWVAKGLHYLGDWKRSEFVGFSGRGLERSVFLQELRRKVRGTIGCRGLDIYIEEVEGLTWEMQGLLARQEEEGWIGEELEFGAEVPVRVLGSGGEGFWEAVRRGEVRRDFGELFWREKIRLKPLRERVEKIGLIANEILREKGIAKQTGKEALEELEQYEWPGNVEELENLVVRTGMLAGGEEIGSREWEWGFREGGIRAKGKREEGREQIGEKGEEGQRKKGEEETEKTEEEERVLGLQEAVEVLLSTLVHEVKNPLVAISTFAHLLPERYEEEEFRGEFSRLVGLEVQRLNGVLEMLLEYGQLGAPRKNRVDLQRRVLAALGENKREIAERRISIRTEGLENLPRVDFDEEHVKFVMRRVWESVLGREVEKREGTVKARWQPPQSGEAQGWVELEIWCDGRDGVVKDIHQVQVPGGRYDFEGLSLGLGLARRLMARNRGEMRVYQEEGVGTTILLRFLRAS